MQTAKGQNLHPKTVSFQIFQHSKHADISKSSKPTSQNVAFPNLPRCFKEQNSKSTSQNVAFPNLPTCQQQQELNNLHPKMLLFQIFQYASNSKSSKPTSQKWCLSKSSKIPQTAKAQNLHPKTLPFQIFPKCCLPKSSNMPTTARAKQPISQNVAFPNLPRCLKQQKLKTYIPKYCFSKSSNMPQTAKAQNLYPKNGAFPNLPRYLKQQKLKTYIPKRCLPKSSKMLQAAKILKLHPKMLLFQIFQDASNNKSSKPISQNVAFPNLPRCLKQQKLKTYIPKYCSSKSSKMPRAAKAQTLHPKMLPSQIFQDGSNNKSSQPTFQNLTFPKLPTFGTCQKQQKLKTYIPKSCLSKSSYIRNMQKTAKAQNLHPKMLPPQIFQDASNSKSSKPTSQNVAFPNLPRCPQNAKAQNLPPKMLLLQIFQNASNSKHSNLHPKTSPFQSFQHLEHAKNSKSSKPTSPNLAFPNRPTFETCKEQQKLKTYLPKCCCSKFSKMPRTANTHPKTSPFQSFQDLEHAKNSKNSKPISQNVAFPNLPRCLKQQKLKTYIPKCCLPKSSKMPQTAKAQNLHSKMLPFQILQDALNRKN